MKLNDQYLTQCKTEVVSLIYVSHFAILYLPINTDSYRLFDVLNIRAHVKTCARLNFVFFLRIQSSFSCISHADSSILNIYLLVVILITMLYYFAFIVLYSKIILFELRLPDFFFSCRWACQKYWLA